MSDDLILLITFVSTSKTLDKVVLKVEHGLNNKLLKDYEFYRETQIWENFEKLLPLHVNSFIDYVVAVEEIFEATIIETT